MLHTKNEIDDELMKHYTPLFQSTVAAAPADFKVFLSSPHLPCLTTEQRVELDESLTLLEVQDSIHVLAAGKTLGPDGLPADFYKIAAVRGGFIGSFLTTS
ncbi:hypothetical protein NDU88_009302 [Pleurodeles waltl]|uniref:Uncharacterized protein n=1 Tax=Pleurodeles waltl TaxID=8319 RepID=A0AAV7RUU1_PLEWA|nr:hypothetical protein NDU88_009302 [Pleurodeles waltl]